MKYIFGVIAVILIIGIAGFLLPSIIGISIGIGMIKAGSVIGGLIVIAIGIAINVAMVCGSSIEGGSSGYHHDDDCPYCGSGDTDGNHCYNCDEDF